MASPGPPQPIASVEELREQLPAILEAINESGDIGRRAVLNPLLGLEELGYEIAPQIRRYVERRVRFEPEDAERLGALEAEVHERTGRAFDLDDPEQLARVLFLELELGGDGGTYAPAPRKRASKRGAERAGSVDPALAERARPLEPQLDRPGDPPSDPLAELEDRHPVMRPLLEYRRLEAKRPRLATAEEYARARDTGEGLPVTRVQVSLHKRRGRKERG